MYSSSGSPKCIYSYVYYAMEQFKPGEIEFYNREYIKYYGFPNSTNHFYKEVRHISSILTENCFPVVFSGCDMNCSVGGNVRAALPGSDIDGWSLLIDSTSLNEYQLQRMVFDSTDHTLINDKPHFILTLDELDKLANITLEEAKKDLRVGLSQKVKALVLMSQIRFGQTLFSNQNLLDRYKHSALFNTTEKPRAYKLQQKHVVRRTIETVFPTLTEREKFTLIRTQQILADFPFTLYEQESPFAKELKNLAVRGFYTIDNSSGFKHYFPAWLAS